jgi:hypothetical protein
MQSKLQPSTSSRIHRAAPQSNELSHQITIIDPHHPLYGQTFPVLRARSSRPNSGLVVILPNGHTRTVSRSATDLDQPPAERSPLPVISAFTLLPLARYVHDKVLSLEEQTHDPSTKPQVTDPILTTTATDERNADDTLEGPGRETADAIDKTFGRTDSTSPTVTGTRGRRAR